MAAFAVAHRECDRQVADAAKLTVQDPSHREMLRSFLLDIEDVRMAVVAVEPPGMLFMGEYRRWNTGPFRLKQERFYDCYVAGRFHREILHGLYQAPGPCLCPVDLVSVL